MLNLSYKRTTAPRSLAPDKYFTLILTFSEKDLHCILILIHATWTVSYKLE